MTRRPAALLIVLFALIAIGWRLWTAPSESGSPAASSPTSGTPTPGATASTEATTANAAPPKPDQPPVIAPAVRGEGLALLDRYTPDETRLFADVERVTRRPVPATLQQLIDRRREGAAREELVALAKELGRDDVLLRATALQWIDRTMPPSDAR